MPTCTALHSFGVDAIGLGHVACSSDCYGASITDATLALHCAVNALAIMRKTGGKGRMKIAVLTALWSNASWCIFGAHVWLQPGGWCEDPFDLLFRLNGISQAVLVFSWCVGGGWVGEGLGEDPHQSSHATLRARPPQPPQPSVAGGGYSPRSCAVSRACRRWCIGS